MSGQGRRSYLSTPSKEGKTICSEAALPQCWQQYGPLWQRRPLSRRRKLKEVVVTATKTERNTQDITQSVTVITAKELHPAVLKK